MRVAPAVFLDVHVERVVLIHVGVAEPGGEDAQPAQLAAVLVRDDVVGIDHGAVRQYQFAVLVEPGAGNHCTAGSNDVAIFIDTAGWINKKVIAAAP